MQKNGILMRLISCTLALVLLVGMIPMGALRVYAADETATETPVVTDPAESLDSAEDSDGEAAIAPVVIDDTNVTWHNVYEGDYGYKVMTPSELQSAAANGGEIVLTFEDNGQVVAVSAVYSETNRRAEFAYRNVTVTGPDQDGFYTFSSNVDAWELKAQSNGFYIQKELLAQQDGYSWTADFVISVQNAELVVHDSWSFLAWTPQDGAAEGGISLSGIDSWDNSDYKLGYLDGKLFLDVHNLSQEGEDSANFDARIYAPVLKPETAVNAALYAQNYTCGVAEFTQEYYNNILAQAQVLLDTNGDKVTDQQYALNNLPEGNGFHYTITRPKQDGNTEVVTAIDTTGVYTIIVYGKNTNGTDVELGSFTITIEAPKSITLSIATDGTLDGNGNLSLGTGKTANITTSLAVTMEDGTVVPADMLKPDITVTAESNWNNYIEYSNGVVKGNSQGNAQLKATLGSSLKINGLEVLGAFSGQTISATLNVVVFQINYVDLDASKIPGSVTIDVAEAGKTSAEITLGYLKSAQYERLPDGAEVKYECEISDPNSPGIHAEVVQQNDGTYKLLIDGATAKGTATVTVKLVFTEDADNWETGTVTEKTINVNVTYNATEPYEFTVTPSDVLVGVGLTKRLQAAVTQNGNAVANPVITWGCDDEDIATVDTNGIVTGKAVGTTTVTATVTYQLPNETEQRTESVQIPVKVAAGADLYEMTVSPESTTINIGGKLSPNVVVKYQGEVITPESLSWSTNDSDVVTVENGVITAKGRGSATVTVTYTSADSIQLSKTISLTVTEPVLELGVGKTNDTYYIPVGASMPLVPHVDMSDEFGSYEVTWQIVDGAGNVISTDVITVTEKTYGGLREEGATGITGIQSIDNAKQNITAKAEGTVFLKAYLSKVNGIEVSGTPDIVAVTVVPQSSTTKITETDFYNRDDRLHTPKEDEENPYEFRILDQHTFMPDSNGLDARIGAVAGDTRVDFSQVKVAVYKNGQLLLDDQGNPFIIPTSELSFYDVSTDKVGWVKVRVTYKDFYEGQITLFGDGATSASTVPGYFYDEYTTGEGCTDGCVWMYVRPKTTYSFTATALVDGEPVDVTMTITDIRPWIGEGAVMENENVSYVPGFQRERAGESSDTSNVQDLPSISISYTYNNVDYQYTTYGYGLENGKGDAYSCSVTWKVYQLGGITGEGSENGAVQDRFWKGKENVSTDDVQAYGELRFVMEGITLDNVYYAFNQVSEKTIPVIVREDSVHEATAITFGYTPSWGGQATAYKSYLGGINITAYAISYVSDLSDEHFQIGVIAGKGSFPVQKVGGAWAEWFSLDVPLGTTAVETTFHTVTRNDGVVFIFNPEDDAAEVNYTIELNPQMLVLSAPGADIEGYENTGEVQATVRDSEGNLISETATVTVQWTMRNTSFASATELDISETTATNSGSFTGPNSEMITVEGMSAGVTYFTVQLMKIVFADGTEVDASGQGIADYAIIYVIDTASTNNMSVVVDYGKPIDISLAPLINAEQPGYNFIGFSDLQHSLRQNAVTTYGDISIDDGVATYIQSRIMDGVDEIYVIFQFVENGNYSWHHHLLNIIPATVMYYETEGNVASEFTYVGDWSSKETANTVPESDTDHHPDVQDDYLSDTKGGNEIYGYDSSYDYDAKLSNQSSKYTEGRSTAQEVAGTGEKTPSTSTGFTFTGTGFDIIARTGVQQATVRVHVYNSEDEKVKTVSVICKGTNELYQIPVIAVRDLSSEPATYRVEIIVYDAYDPWKALDEETQKLFGDEVLNQLARGNEFYFDAIRIYDPVKGDLTAQAAYAADGECSQTIQQVGNLLVDQNKFQETTSSAVAVGNGAVFMDSYNLGGTSEKDGFITTSQVGTYEAVGPNNEVYLGEGQGIAFILNTKGGVPDSIQIGAKSITGDMVILNAKLVSASTANDTVTYTTTNSPLKEEIYTSTAMYYELSNEQELESLFADGNQVYVVIWNTENSVLSITDIKFAYKDATAQAVEFLYSAELASVAAATISEYEDQTYLKRIGEEWCYCDSNGEVIVYSGLVQTQDSGIWYVVDGKVDFSYSGVYRTEAGERYSVRSGRVETTLNGIAERDGQWLYFTAGRVDTSFTGIAPYGDSGEWYVLNGEVQVSNSETITLNGVTYTLENGKVISNS